MVRAVISTHTRSGQSQHWAQAFTARLNQMRRYFGNARGVLGCHPRTDHYIYCVQIISQRSSKLLVWFGRYIIKAHS
jgi:hypothetical protein